MVDTRTGELHTTEHTESTRQGEPDNQTGRENPDFSGGVQDSGARLDHRATGDRQSKQTDNDATLKDNDKDNQSFDQLYTDNDNYEEYINSDNYSGIPADDDSDEDDQNNLDKISTIYAEKDCHKAGASLSFEKLCKHHNIPHEMHDCYYQWLMGQTTEYGMGFSQESIPRSRPSLQGGGYIEPGLMIPPPHGKLWRDILDLKGLKRSEINKQRVIKSNMMVKEAISMTHQAVKIIHDISNSQSQDETEHIIEAYKIRKNQEEKNQSNCNSGGQNSTTGHFRSSKKL